MKNKIFTIMLIVLGIVIVMYGGMCISMIVNKSNVIINENDYVREASSNVVETENDYEEYVQEPENEIQVKLYENRKIEINNDTKFYIKVNYLQNVVNIYTEDERGEFTVPVKAMVCSTGVSTPTQGVYKMSDRGVWGMMVGRVWAQYYSRINGVILFHSVPYTAKSKNSLEYWEYDKLGTSASAGCVRLTVQDAKWIYDYCKAGTQVEFYADEDPGPFGKPEATKISESDETHRVWDPTDPDDKNPWRESKKLIISTNEMINFLL